MVDWKYSESIESADIVSIQKSTLIILVESLLNQRAKNI